MTEFDIPDYAQTLRIAAQTHTAKVTEFTVKEQRISGELSRFQEWAATERERIQRELDEAQAKATAELRQMTDQEAAMTRDLREAGLHKARHARDAEGAQKSWLEWCQREGIDATAVPPLETSGPQPVTEALPALAERTNGAALAPFVPGRPSPNGMCLCGNPDNCSCPPARVFDPDRDTGVHTALGAAQESRPSLDPVETVVDAGGERPGDSGRFPGDGDA